MSALRRFSLTLFAFGFFVVSAVYAQDDDPLNTVRSDYIYLHRSQPTRRNLVTTTSSGGTVLLNATDFDLGYSNGWDISLMRNNVLDTGWNLEALYFSVDDWLATDTVTSNGGSYIRYQTAIGNASNRATIMSNYRSNLHNFELNVRHEMGSRGSFLMGVRYVHLREHLGILDEMHSTTSPYPLVNRLNSQTETTNYLIGAQAGFDGYIYKIGRFELGGFAKAGIYNNAVNNYTTVTQTSPVQNINASARAVRTSFVGDAAVIGAYKYSEHLTFRAGYQLLVIGGAAAVTDQVTLMKPTASPPTGNVNYWSSPVYYGPFAGMEFSF
jgi:hypothetical protein